jgi:hypothetical protein
MGWQDYLKPEKKEGFPAFPSQNTREENFHTNTPYSKGTLNKSNLLLLSNNCNFKSPPSVLKAEKAGKGQEPELKTVWKNTFPQGTPEARAESLRVVAEAVADMQSSTPIREG